MQITCEHKLACRWLAASELDHNLFLNLEFSAQSLLEIRLQNTTVNCFNWVFLKSQVTAECRVESSFPVEFTVCPATYFQPQGCPVTGQVRPQVRSRTYLQLTWILFVLRLPPGQQTIQRVRSLKFSHSKYASYTWVIPHKPTARAIQKDVLDKRSGKIWRL